MDVSEKPDLDRREGSVALKCDETEAAFEFEKRGALDLGKDCSQHRRYASLFEDLMN